MSKRRFKDRITGDELTLGEKVAWEVTGIIRRWTVFIAIQVIAVLWLTLGSTYARTWYNYAWSDWAIVIENVTMLCLFMQTRRDAVVMRKVLAIEEKTMVVEQTVLRLERRLLVHFGIKEEDDGPNTVREDGLPPGQVSS